MKLAERVLDKLREDPAAMGLAESYIQKWIEGTMVGGLSTKMYFNQYMNEPGAVSKDKRIIKILGSGV